MSFILEQLSERAQTLPPDERAQLAEHMLRSLSSQTDPTVDAEWSVEIRRRVSEIQSGSAPLVSVDNLFAQIRRTFA
jgi:putative addiction module component (TIGR02574 family)